MRFGKETLSLIVVAGIVGGAIGSAVAPSFASARLDLPARLAGFFDDILNFFRP